VEGSWAVLGGATGGSAPVTELGPPCGPPPKEKMIEMQ